MRNPQLFHALWSKVAKHKPDFFAFVARLRGSLDRYVGHVTLGQLLIAAKAGIKAMPVASSGLQLRLVPSLGAVRRALPLHRMPIFLVPLAKRDFCR
jgi:hypothetical protein